MKNKTQQHSTTVCGLIFKKGHQQNGLIAISLPLSSLLSSWSVQEDVKPLSHGPTQPMLWQQ